MLIAVPDRYPHFAALAVAEVEQRDFSIESVCRKSPVLLMAPHGGEIEQGTSEIARAIAGDDLSLYIFAGMDEARGTDLHITSTRFDEPTALRMARSSHCVVTVHGERSLHACVFLGGLDTGLRKKFSDALQAAGFRTAEHHNPGLQGVSSANICNRGGAGAGIQLELSRGLRRSFFAGLDGAGRQRPTAALRSFAAAVRAGLAAAGLI